jgi:flagellar protein FlgJ
MTPLLFIATIKPDAQVCAHDDGWPLAALLAVPALETGWGNLLVQGGLHTHNLFNIKGEGPAGYVLITADDWLTQSEWNRYKEQGVQFTLTGKRSGNKLEGRIAHRYRCYHSFTDSYADFTRLLHSQPRYSPVRHTADPYAFCTALQACGFATDPEYAQKLHYILRHHVIPLLD